MAGAGPARPARRWWLACAVLLGLVLAGCGGGSSEPAEPEEPYVEPIGPGELKATLALGRVTPAEIRQALLTAGRQAPAVAPVYEVASYRLSYQSSDSQGRPILVSGLLCVPVKPSGARSPVLGYQHGTLFRDAEAPSNHAVPAEAAVVMASLGYIVMAPDYLGYGVSKGTPHPYLLAAPSAAAVIDGLSAAKTWRVRNRTRDNGQLFLAGYSEGGYVTMAAHRAMQQAAGPGAAMQLTALAMAVPGAGPYHVGVTLDTLLERVRDENPLLGLLISPGLLKNLGASVRRQVRDELLARVLPEDADIVFDATFIDNYLDDNTAEIERVSNVHDWKPLVPVALYHGRDDRTVPYEVSTVTLAAMRARGAAGVSLTDCPAVPSGHLDCVLPYWNFMLARLATLARDL